MKRDLLNRKGSIDDIRCSLGFIAPKDKRQAYADIEWLTDSLRDETMNKKRASVISMIEARIRRIQKKYNIDKN